MFLQQLGRGLRLAEDKECLTVLDFIGQANKRYNFEDKFAALLISSLKRKPLNTYWITSEPPMGTQQDWCLVWLPLQRIAAWS